jgi:hypothetical protein
MPVINYGGQQYYIPFDPVMIAQLIFNGFEVSGDSGISPEQARVESEAIHLHLRKLWGDTQLRTTPGRRDQNDPPVSMPDTGYENPAATGRKYGTGIQQFEGRHNYQKVTPNPYIDFNIREIGTEPRNITEANAGASPLDEALRLMGLDPTPLMGKLGLLDKV